MGTGEGVTPGLVLRNADWFCLPLNDCSAAATSLQGCHCSLKAVDLQGDAFPPGMTMCSSLWALPAHPTQNPGQRAGTYALDESLFLLCSRKPGHCLGEVLNLTLRGEKLLISPQ